MLDVGVFVVLSITDMGGRQSKQDESGVISGSANVFARQGSEDPSVAGSHSWSCTCSKGSAPITAFPRVSLGAVDTANRIRRDIRLVCGGTLQLGSFPVFH